VIRHADVPGLRFSSTTAVDTTPSALTDVEVGAAAVCAAVGLSRVVETWAAGDADE
jgi:hypothetical protein